MDLDGFRSFLLDSGIDVWTWIDMAISVASADHENELKRRRDGIVQKLYAPASMKCQNCDHPRTERTGEEVEKRERKQDSGENLAGIEEEGEGEDEEQRKILEIRVLLDDLNQSERSLIDLLQMLVDMDISFKALKETDIGRHVTKLRKHSSGEVRRLVKILVRKWKDTVDEWVRLNTPEEATECIDDKKSSPNEAHENLASCFSTPIKGNLRQNQAESVNQGSCTAKQSHQESQLAKKQRITTGFHNHSNNGGGGGVGGRGGSVPINYW